MEQYVTTTAVVITYSSNGEEEEEWGGIKNRKIKFYKVWQIKRRYNYRLLL